MKLNSCANQKGDQRKAIAEPRPEYAPGSAIDSDNCDYLRRLRMIINAPATKASAFAPVAASISGTEAARQLPATPIPIKAIPATFMTVLLNIFPPVRLTELQNYRSIIDSNRKIVNAKERSNLPKQRDLDGTLTSP
jgi:hypothetical protein